ncbi:metallophosphoesterase [Streptomyces sp. NPDC006704]|uniref:metallophosphoesterase n=1 Tax=Streptomyces sp. NPDC006704 TaxID=3364760 RepID=UPI0036A04DD0
MTQGAGQGPVRTETLRDFRVPPYAQQAPVPPPEEPPAYPEPMTPELRVERAAPERHEEPAAPEFPQGPAAPEARHESAGAGFQQGAADPEVRHQPMASEPRFGPVDPEAHHEPAGPEFQQEPPAAHPQASAPLTPPPAPGTATSSGDEPPEGYTPTARDLPVITRGDTLQVPLAEPDPASAPSGPGPLYVVGDVHGYLDELMAALREQGLIDESGSWAAGTARLWFLGDFTDRGPDGIGVIDLVMRLSAEAAAAGGYCKALMGNHELLLIGAKRFADTPVNSGAGTATFQAAWLLNGGQKADMDRLQDVHLQWMSRLDAIEQEDDHLLMHSDTTAYLEYGDSIEAVNDTVHAILTRNDADECWDLFRKLTKRFAFRDGAGPQAARELLAAYGGRRVVHGHSPIPYLLGEVGTEDGEEDSRPVVEGPHLYADGLALAMDGGVTMAGKLLVQQLPLGD